ncbi:ABC transporter substrate-binding protein [Paenibacillus gorillae]|uniref:ABC transporter substrate-binding protein n=1 Tax=Paenibacillus gorillae TaxID=1243662 RepID=UPI0004BA2C90|nr:extracellular solute-binding protein [Paenibacillus gorillae]
MSVYVRMLTICMTAAILFTACSSSKQPVSGKIKVMYFNEYSFGADYANLFQSSNPNIELELAELTMERMDPNNDADLQQWLEREQPDILLLSARQYKEMAREGKLLTLDDLVKQSKYSLDSITPGVLDTLKSMGDGELYGLSPTFSSTALFYNKDLFDRYHVEYPTDGMTWDEVLQIAERFAGEGEGNDRIYGLSLLPWESTPNGLLSKLDETAGLKWLDPVRMKLAADTAAHQQNAEKAVAAFQKEIIPYIDIKNQVIDMNFYKEMPFVKGRSAMYLGDFTLFKSITAELKSSNSTMNWDLVTEPVNPQYPEQSSTLALGNIFAININSPNRQAAWTFLKFAGSEELAKIKSNSTFELLSRTVAMKEMDGHSLEPFYKHKFAPVSAIPKELPLQFLQNYNQLREQQLKEVLDKQKSIHEALGTIQEEGQMLLDASLLEHKQKP